jgi:hypothetical protein
MRKIKKRGWKGRVKEVGKNHLSAGRRANRIELVHFLPSLLIHHSSIPSFQYSCFYDPVNPVKKTLRALCEKLSFGLCGLAGRVQKCSICTFFAYIFQSKQIRCAWGGEISESDVAQGTKT